MNFSTDVVQEVTELNLDVHGGAGCAMNPRAEKLVRDVVHLEPPRRRHGAARSRWRGGSAKAA